FYLWQSIPDQSLLDAAASGELLSSPQVYEAQVNRMLADPKTKRSIREFVYEWLELYELPAEVDNSVTFTHFAGSLSGTNFSSLRQAMVDEVLDFAVHIIFEKKGRYSDLLLSRWFSTNSAVLAQQVYG